MNSVVDLPLKYNPVDAPATDGIRSLLATENFRSKILVLSMCYTVVLSDPAVSSMLSLYRTAM